MLKFRLPFHKVELYYNALRSICTAEIRPSPKTYYEILNLNRDCSAKEVRDAFIKLSKQMHPDKNLNDPLNHQRFVKINEAYNILSRPQKRNAYDLTLRNNQSQRTQTSYSTESTSQYADYYKLYNFHHSEYSRTRDYKNHKRLSKPWIVSFCVMFASVGVGLQILLIRNSLTFSREKLDKMTEENSRILTDVHCRANENGFEKQLEFMKQKIENSVDQYNQSKRTNE